MAVTLLIQACGKKDKTVAGTPLTIATPFGFPERTQFKNEQLTVEKAELGSRLFYDKRLSRDGSISCPSCHQQTAAFGI